MKQPQKQLPENIQNVLEKKEAKKMINQTVRS